MDVLYSTLVIAPITPARSPRPEVSNPGRAGTALLMRRVIGSINMSAERETPPPQDDHLRIEHNGQVGDPDGQEINRLLDDAPGPPLPLPRGVEDLFSHDAVRIDLGAPGLEHLARPLGDPRTGGNAFQSP